MAEIEENTIDNFKNEINLLEEKIKRYKEIQKQFEIKDKKIKNPEKFIIDSN